MSGTPSAGAPLEPQPHRGRAGPSTLLVDAERDGRACSAIDCWYPAAPASTPKSVYELLPGIGFTASALAIPRPRPARIRSSSGRTAAAVRVRRTACSAKGSRRVATS